MFRFVRIGEFELKDLRIGLTGCGSSDLSSLDLKVLESVCEDNVVLPVFSACMIMSLTFRAVPYCFFLSACLPFYIAICFVVFAITGHHNLIEL